MYIISALSFVLLCMLLQVQIISVRHENMWRYITFLYNIWIPEFIFTDGVSWFFNKCMWQHIFNIMFYALFYALF